MILKIQMNQEQIIKAKAITNGSRHIVKLNYKLLLTNKNKNLPKKSLLKNISKKYGRDCKGRLRFRISGGKHGIGRQYRIIDFKRDIYDTYGVVKTIEYDPNRNAFISLIEYKINNKSYFRYILALENLKKGSKIMSFKVKKPSIINGNAMQLRYIPIGQYICNVQMHPNSYKTYARSAGSKVIIISKNQTHAELKMPSGEYRLLNLNCYGTIGRIGNSLYNLIKKGKASANIYRGRRPHVSGLAMNACDHKHGGGKNSSSIGNVSPMTPYGKNTLGGITRSIKRTNRFILKRKRDKKKRQ